jgi:hypothetical protein
MLSFLLVQQEEKRQLGKITALELCSSEEQGSSDLTQ